MRNYILVSRVVLAALFLVSAMNLTIRPAAAAGGNYFPNIPLITHNGKKVHLYDDLLKDKVVVINFIYTSCPNSCPLETARLRAVQELLGDRVGRDIFMYSITIDPEVDTVQVLNHYADKFNIGPGWLFLTGKEDDIILLRKKLGLYMDEIQNGDDLDHNLTMIVGNEATGKWIKRSPFDNPKGLANLIGYDLFDGMVPRKGAKSYASVPEVSKLSRGQYLYRTRCIACHTLGLGDGLGPDLLGVVDKRDRTWLARWLKVPDKMLAEKDPIAMKLFAQYQELAMPNLQLSDIDVAALIDYMAAESRRIAMTNVEAAVKDEPDNHKHH
ncbi:electron transporter SenC [Thalassotalea sp. 42_200_T64]|nr:electron transporter SenC [Thalassotalea sp. 42_200_T64]